MRVIEEYAKAALLGIFINKDVLNAIASNSKGDIEKSIITTAQTAIFYAVALKEETDKFKYADNK